MALACPRCGTQNPDGNRFCLACGTALVASPPVPAMPVGPSAASPFTQPPPAYVAPPGAGYAAPPPTPPPAYQTPYYSPPPGYAPPQVHRTPWLVIIAVVVVLVVVMAGVGTVLAVGLSHGSNNQSGNLSALSSPSPAGSPSPVPSAPAQPSSNPKSASNAGVTVPVPEGWSVASQDTETITLLNPSSDGAITIASGASSPAQTAQQNKDQVDAFFRQQYPDTKNCAGSKTTTGSLNGAAGITWELCFTLTSGAQSMSAAALLFVGANPSGTVYYAMYMLTAASNMPTFANECAPILKGIVWQLK
jgi:hypothetical protein